MVGISVEEEVVTGLRHGVSKVVIVTIFPGRIGCASTCQADVAGL
jgi:hypothetical protein